jgi:phospholipase D1/2
VPAGRGIRPLWSLAKVGAAVVFLLLLVAAWRITPLADAVDPEWLQRRLGWAQRSVWAPAIVVAVFVAAGLVAFPLLVLIAATAAAFGPVLGATYSAAGALASALVTFGIGLLVGRKTLRDLLGPRLNRVRQRLARRGLLAVAAVRLVPIAPFTVVNLVAGASGIRILDFVLGTVIGLAPGLVLISLLGYQAAAVLLQPSFAGLTLLVIVLAAWTAITIGVHRLLTRHSRKAR